MTDNNSNNPNKPAVHLAFSDKYSHEHASDYQKKHEAGFQRRFSNWLEQRAARKALATAGDPKSVIDLPCGAGRFWGLLAEKADRKLYAADYSQGMLDTCQRVHPPALMQRFECRQASAFDTQYPDSFVDCVFSMRLMHHVGQSKDRLVMLREFRRICRETVILSLWVDGNIKAWKRRRLDAKRAAQGKNPNNRFVTPAAQFEAECREAGLQVVAHYDVLPFFLMWRIYVLRKVG
ncbi:class I SAM-dependent methyltransferase [Permianibacter sp. IMCC34836]|uniref:class I SAM-dependent methyltransferase n=1 Tax=Permianibacter fluminis TaxID=2738515 RepID=UPI001556CCF8|nr:class I SAM-dependent methyltransferase [Permianibacter fluminis]NQD35777.1 class I SAM-dependent methyltransferase [Permianibacter fluminis]